jgi:hypothetical protein
LANKDIKTFLISSESQEELKSWLADNGDKSPSYVKEALTHYVDLINALEGNKHQIRSLVLQLQRAMGITASSEKRGNSGDPIGPSSQPGDEKPKDPEERARLKLKRLMDLEAWHRNLAKKHRSSVKKLKEKQKKVEDSELTSKEVEESIGESSELKVRLTSGGESDPSFESPDQVFRKGGDAAVVEETVTANIDPDLLASQTVQSSLIEKRTRYGFSFMVSKLTVEVEKVVIKEEDSSTKILSASTRDFGPPGMAVTWEFLANMAIMVSQYAMPFTRLGKLLSICGKSFGSAMLSRLFCYMAGRFVPIYLYLFHSLRNSSLISGDDTQTRVLEFARHEKILKDNPTADPPWASYGTVETAKASLKKEVSPSLGVQLAAELGFEWDRKDGQGQKKSLHTTVLSGRSEAKDPRSTVVFYRSHIGSFGNLLTLSLGSRSPEFKKLTVQSDLASVNLVTDAKVAARFDLEMAGCASHARRPFALYEAEDSELCGIMLHYFKGLYIYEQCLDLTGRNDTNVRAVRGTDSRQLWIDIKELASVMKDKWSAKTKLGTASRYILRHYKKLTAYLDNPMISISNDFCERMLRLEKLIQANALFRKSLEGRFALDIIRTILQTAVAAKVPLAEYLVFVMKASQDKINANPEAYTPLAYARANKKKEANPIPSAS